MTLLFSDETHCRFDVPVSFHSYGGPAEIQIAHSGETVMFPSIPET
jgi:hypothetical protein